MIDEFYGKMVTNIRAYGIDEFDFTRNLLGVDFSVGQFGYVVFEFGDDCLYISIDGISTIVPPRKNIHELSVHNNIRETFIGAVLSSIVYIGEEYQIQFEDMDLLRGWYVPNDGLTNRSYFELEFPWV